MGSILNEVKKIIKQIKEEGLEINNTKEINNVISTFKISELNLDEEEKDIATYYNENIGNWYARQNLEKNHYRFLESFIIHKVGEVLYFHSKETMTSRKFVIWSQDCIAAIQFLSRENKNIMNVFIRSSDTVNLLLADYLFGCKLLKRVLEEFNIKSNKDDIVTFFTTSSHWYLKDIHTVNKIINEKT